mgnify:CR=1 FL=1
MKYLWNRYTKFILTIIIFFCSAFFQLIPIKLFNINNITPKIQILLTLFSNMMNILLLVLMYYKDLKEDFCSEYRTRNPVPVSNGSSTKSSP